MMNKETSQNLAKMEDLMEKFEKTQKEWGKCTTAADQGVVTVTMFGGELTRLLTYCKSTESLRDALQAVGHSGFCCKKQHADNPAFSLECDCFVGAALDDYEKMLDSLFPFNDA